MVSVFVLLSVRVCRVFVYVRVWGCARVRVCACEREREAVKVNTAQENLHKFRTKSGKTGLR